MPRGGGQEPDYGSISGSKVVDVNKHGGIILHKLDGKIPKEGETVSCIVDETRRSNITKNHTSTHILNSSARGVLGSWVWQHSAFKDDDHARLDITHHSSLTEQQVQDIERSANEVVAKDMSVTIDYYDRGAAEQKYGFKIYQGGVVPVKSVRIVSIEDFDVEACGGTHVKKTKDIELIKITRTKRIQDGVVRIEFVSGPTAQKYVEQQKVKQSEQAEESAQKEMIEKQREERKQKDIEKMRVLFKEISEGKSGIIEEIEMKDKCRFTSSKKYNEFFHQKFGGDLVKMDKKIAYCGVYEADNAVWIIVFCGEQSGKKCRRNCS